MTEQLAESNLANLVDQLAVRRTVEIYEDALCRRDPDRYGACLAPDARWIVGPPNEFDVQGRDAIVATLAGIIGSFDFFVHTAHNIVVDVDGDTATCRSTVQELGRAADGGAVSGVPAMSLWGFYDDELRRDGDGWVFTKRVYSPFFVDTTTVPEGTSFPIVR